MQVTHSNIVKPDKSEVNNDRNKNIKFNTYTTTDMEEKFVLLKQAFGYD